MALRPTEKVCGLCRRFLAASEFYKNGASFDGLQSRCKKCVRDDPKAKAARRRSSMRYNYGITPEQRDALFESQGRMCAVCLSKDPKGGWNIDHCHVTKRVRGILCGNCNRAAGLLAELAKNADRLAAYLRAAPLAIALDPAKVVDGLVVP